MAAQWNHPKVAQILIEHKANTECLDNEGNTPLEVAQKHESKGMIKFLSKLV